jgi:teichuronic acid biosynthesis glycosyltransferase TuaG
VIPAYRAEAFLAHCLDSVAAQTHRNWEVIIVDDGSPDATAAVATAWVDRHAGAAFQLVRQPNRGIGAARNAGLHIARAPFLAFLDADDRWLPAKLERVSDFLASHPSVDLVCHDETLLSDTAPPRHLRHGPHASWEDLLFKGNSVSTSATVVRRVWVIEAGGFSENLDFNGAEDYDLWLRLARSGCRFAYLHEALGVYRVHPGGITGQAEVHCRNHLNVLDAHFRALPRPGLGQRWAHRRRRAAMLRGAVFTLMARREYGRADTLLRRAVREDPVAWKTWALLALNTARVAAR